MPEEKVDTGHEALIKDLSSLLKEAEAYAFHDFKNSEYATPKVELERRALLIAQGTRDGKYDN